MQGIRNNESTTALIRQLKASETQYKVLTKEEEQALIDKYWNTDRDKCKELLVMHNIRVVFNIAKKYALKSVDFDETVARGFYGLMEAINRFDPSTGNKFITYATPWVFKYVVGHFYDKDDQVSATSMHLNTHINEDKNGSDDQSGATYENLLADNIGPTYKLSIDPTEQIVEKNEVNDIYRAVSDYVQTSVDFTETDRQVFQRAFIENDTVRQISADLDLPISEVNKTKYSLLTRLRKYLKETMKISSMEDLVSIG